MIFNTTFCMTEKQEHDFLHWMRKHHIPKSLKLDFVHTPQFTKIVSQELEGVNYSLQLKTENIETLQMWYEEVGDQLLADLSKHFGEDVLTFSTLLEEVSFE